VSVEFDRELSPEQSAEILRLTLPDMARYKVPVTPPNYAVWYSYTSKIDQQLNDEIDNLINSRVPFTAEINERLFQQFVSECDIAQFSKIRGEMAEILKEVSGSLADAGNEADQFSGTLDNLVKDVENTNDLDDIRRLLGTLVEETRSMRRSTQLLHEHLESRSREVLLLQEELEQERKRASSDPLTGLANRAALYDELEQQIAELSPGAKLSLLMLDIDHFKRINDIHGHLIGDRVLRYVAKALQQNTKGMDLAARYGGEEFAVLLPETGVQGAKAVAETIRHAVAIAKLVRADNKESLGQITVSVGVAQYVANEDSAELINRADQALYSAKQAGRNRVTIATQPSRAQRA